MKKKSLKSLSLKRNLISNLQQSQSLGGVPPRKTGNILVGGFAAACPQTAGCQKSHEPDCHSNDPGCNCGTSGNC
jgi:hypothetical protein